MQNTFLISNLTNHFNVLSKEDEEHITKIPVELYMIDPLQSGFTDIYQYKKYNILLYSAYRELNSALYHISELTSDEIYYYNDDVIIF